MTLSQSEAKKAAEYAEAEEYIKCLAEEAAGEGEKIRWGGISRICGVKYGCWGSEATEDGSWSVVGFVGFSGFVGLIVSAFSAGFYRFGLIVLLDRIVSARLYCIVSFSIGWVRKHWLLRIGWLLPGWDGWDRWTGWGVGATGVGRTYVSRRQNRRATVGSGTGAPLLALQGWKFARWLLTGWDGWYGWTGWNVGGTGVIRADVSRRRNRSAIVDAIIGAPPLALEGRRAVQSGSWHQLCWCCKDGEYLCRRRKIIQIECTEIRTSNVVEDIIQSTYNTIVVWLHTTINCMSNIVPKKKSQKMPLQIFPNIEDSVRNKVE